MVDVASLLTLPFMTLMVLGCGYVGYRLAFTGRDSAHNTADVVFLSVVFAAIAQAVLLAFPGWWIIVGAPVSLAVTAAAAIAWRVWIGHWLREALRKQGISDHDGCINVWQSMLARPLHMPMRLVVKLSNGGTLMCSDLRPFIGAPMGPCLLGEDGSVALYVTDTMAADQGEWAKVKPYDPERPTWGYEMTFVPATQIPHIDVTRPA